MCNRNEPITGLFLVSYWFYYCKMKTILIPKSLDLNLGIPGFRDWKKAGISRCRDSIPSHDEPRSAVNNDIIT